MTLGVKFSPLALAQLDMIWDYGFERFGVERADVYIDCLFDAL
jgi:plasmid stabilization system protein ParE